MALKFKLVLRIFPGLLSSVSGFAFAEESRSITLNVSSGSCPTSMILETQSLGSEGKSRMKLHASAYISHLDWWPLRETDTWRDHPDWPLQGAYFSARLRAPYESCHSYTRIKFGGFVHTITTGWGKFHYSASSAEFREEGAEVLDISRPDNTPTFVYAPWD